VRRQKPPPWHLRLTQLEEKTRNERYSVNGILSVSCGVPNLLGGDIGVDNIGTGTVDATENWWGCPNGPGTGGCTTVKGTGVFFTPRLRHPMLEIGN
jgi:hypothetical protein